MIGIVYMTLVQDSDPNKHYLMEPIWAGNVPRSEWALLFLATPVMFYSTGMFHRRSIKEIHALWRRGSKTPVWRRFVRFGSMNLLVSLGVSVAYFSSIALLALAAVQEPNMEGENVTYFDSVVLLSMFLLAGKWILLSSLCSVIDVSPGRYLEAYSKSRTADAITALASLRPHTALLVTSERHSSALDEIDNGQEVESSSSSQLDDLEKATPVLPTRSVQMISVDLLEIGDIVRVTQGSSPPADGTIISGEHGAFDESSLTGESRFIEKQAGDTVRLGTINKANVVHIKIERLSGKTM